MNRLTRFMAATPAWSGEVLVTLAGAMLIALALGIGFLNSDNWPSGGDSASHLLYVWLYAEELFFSGHITPWMPEVFGGLPFLSYYFPLPYIVMAMLSQLLGVASAFKWGAFLAAMILPGAVYAASRHWLKFSWPAALFGALGALAFLMHEQNSIWGGNLLSTLAGEFSYSYSVLFAVLALIAWSRAVSQGKGWILAGLLEAACGFSHGFPLLVAGFSTAFLLLDISMFKRTFGLLVRGHLLAFCLLGGWLWPMMEMHGITIPNDAAFPLSDWRDLLPATLWPVLAAGVLGLTLLLFPSVRRSWGVQQIRVVALFASGAGLSAIAFIAGDQMGLADIRFFPLTWVLGAIACGWLFGQALAFVGSSASGEAKLMLLAARGLFAAAVCLGLLGWIASKVHSAPDWGLWNHSGLDAKPQFYNLSKLFPAMSGDLWSPRLLFEHDPANNDIGSTRTLEALSMFLNHRPVLEGLYMESAILGPAIYMLQSEVSEHPSSPLVRFPSASLDPQFAARHMQSLHSDTLLLRSAGAKFAIEASGLFEKIAESPPFAVYKLRQFDSHLAQVVTQPLRILPQKDWMQDSFDWFRTRSRFESYQPVYPVNSEKFAASIKPVVGRPPQVVEKLLSRHEFIFQTEAIGQPHLIKIAYHPRWHLQSKGSLSIAAPGFMLVVPEEREIRLVYGHTLIGNLGMAATVGALLYLLFLGWRRYTGRVPQIARQEESSGAKLGLLRHGLPLLLAWVVLAAGGVGLAQRSPERVYSAAWEAMRAGEFEQASKQFARAYELRRPPSKKEEALFWTAKALEDAGNRSGAIARYRELCDNYHGFWLPEGLFNLILLVKQEGNALDTENYKRRLLEEYPNNAWALRLEGIISSQSSERVYEYAWELMRANQFQDASIQFARAYELRQLPAAKEEALFWLAKSNERAGNNAEAKKSYRELVANYRGYWLPESLYTLFLLEHEEGYEATAGKWASRLRREFPGNSWTLKLDTLK